MTPRVEICRRRNDGFRDQISTLPTRHEHECSTALRTISRACGQHEELDAELRIPTLWRPIRILAEVNFSGADLIQ